MDQTRSMELDSVIEVCSYPLGGFYLTPGIAASA
jgi:hypothetical protein